ncbi:MULTISPECIES: PilZ domain-containing protein [Silvimonas]|uniref:PilZ domain-containing protein n=1 Tax=Silvimonas TaxID=300264 RepID=UPI0024B360FA|nr:MULTISPECIES: PilZ domain-containing protein [Silvimonas]MDR3429177.1 PilZ domain-containing protein [Silvimonas sp.]
MPNFPDGLYYQTSLPLAWLDAPVQSELEAQRYLEVLEAMEQHPHEGIEVSQVEARLDLQLLWLARLLTPQKPPERDAEIGIEHIRWSQTDAPQVGAEGYVGMILSPSLPYLLSIAATITEVEPVDGAVQVMATWTWQIQSLREAFERTVFRHHRVQIRRNRGAVS